MTDHTFNLALATDFYQLTMANGYLKSGIAERRACFQLYFRKAPFQSAYALAAGLQNAMAFLENYRFTKEDLAFLNELKSAKGAPIFDDALLSYLAQFRFTCDVEAIPEGKLVFAGEPMLQITGPLIQCQLLETPLLNLINFQTLIATKSSRVRFAAGDDEVIDFGLRRAQGFDGGISASRAAYIGGCDATSNVFAGKRFGIPLRGTMAHSWVMAIGDEKRAFATYAEHMPDNCILLVDTYDTLRGIENAIETGRELAVNGHHLRGIRLDSGDLLALSRIARDRLDQAGMRDTKIIASSDLDEYRIAELKAHGAPIDAWGVGTKLITAFEEPALGGIYKLVALENEKQQWQYPFKVSNDAAKATTPGIFQIRRYWHEGHFVRDFIFERDSPPPDKTSDHEDLLVPIFKKGLHVYDPPSLSETRALAKAQLLALPPKARALKNPASYGVVFDPVLISRREMLVEQAKG